MKKFFTTLSVIIVLAIGSVAQMSSHTAFRIRFGAALPATCSPSTGDVFFKTAATIGAYQCLVANTWSAMGAAGSFPDLTDNAGVSLTSGVRSFWPDGTVAAPSYSFTNGTGAGINFITSGGRFQLVGNTFDVFSTGNFGTTNPVMMFGAGATEGIRMTSTACFGFSSSTPNAAASDTFSCRDTAGFIAIKGASNAVAGVRTYGGNGDFIEYGTSSELLTIAAAATTDSVGTLLPANSVIDSVNVRVTTVIPTAATFTVGDATTAARFATGVSTAANTTAVGLTHVDQTGAAGPKQTAAAKVRITPNLTPGTATGVVRITVHYHSLTAPTS